ncbi:MAG: carboxypeptidase-like regulatory domain-containing protein [Caldilineaceae bacterium]
MVQLSMAHLSEEQLYAIVFAELDENSFTQDAQRDETAAAHLAVCNSCRTQLAELRVLVHELRVAQASTPSAAALARYDKLYAQVEQSPSWANRVINYVTAQLRWDGRQQPAWQGVRNAAAASFRLLYSSTQADIELLVEHGNGEFHVEGEILPLQGVMQELPVLCELQMADNQEVIFATESEADGRFHLTAIPPGRYTLFVTPPLGSAVVIDQLQLH